MVGAARTTDRYWSFGMHGFAAGLHIEIYWLLVYIRNKKPEVLPPVLLNSIVELWCQEANPVAEDTDSEEAHNNPQRVNFAT